MNGSDPRQAFSPEMRVKLCDRCNAAFPIPMQGGTVTCPKCGASQELPPRAPPRAVKVSSRQDLTTAQRLEMLLQQDGTPLLPPESVSSLVRGGALLEGKIDEAYAAWHSSARQARDAGDYEAAERLAFLTTMLLNRESGTDHFWKVRALLDGMLESSQLPRHVQLTYANLSRWACRVKDFASAEAWAALCDEHSTDLAADSCWRAARAMLDTCRGRYREVLGVVGEGDEVPIDDAFDLMCGVLRANAWERTGRADVSQRVLGQLMKRAHGREYVTEMVSRWDLCTVSYPAALRAVEESAAQDSYRRAGGQIYKTLRLGGLIQVIAGLVIPVLFVLDHLGIAEVMEAPKGDPGSLVGAVMALLLVGGFGSGMLLFAARKRREAEEARRLRLEGVAAWAEIRGRTSTGLRVNGVPQWRIDMLVQPEGKAAFEASSKLLMGEPAVSELMPGVRVRVRFDPSDKSKVLVETFS